MNRSVLVLLAAALGVAVPGCHRAQAGTMTAPAVEFDTGQVQIVSATDTFLLQVEITETLEQQQVGLRGRESLPEDAGMIFLFAEEQPDDSGFWMYRTYVPLSVAFLDAEGTIRGMLDMEPCRSRISLWCPSYEAGVPYRAALEVNRGYFARRGIGVGDRVILLRAPRPSMDRNYNRRGS